MRKKTANSSRRMRRPANRASVPALDGFDRKILQALVDNARASNVEIAQKVGLSEAPCSRRIRRLEDDEVILGYHARLDPETVECRNARAIRRPPNPSARTRCFLAHFASRTSENCQFTRS